jgi:hypothetical protein
MMMRPRLGRAVFGNDRLAVGVELGFGGEPDIRERDFQVRKWWELDDVVAFAGAGGAVFFAVELESFDGAGLRIDDPVESDADVFVLLEFVLAVNADARGAEDLDAEVGRAFDYSLDDGVQPLLCDEDDIGSANVELPQDGINVAYEFAKIIFNDVIQENRRKPLLNPRMIEIWAWAHSDLSVNQLEAHTGGILAELKELFGGHPGGTD